MKNYGFLEKNDTFSKNVFSAIAAFVEKGRTLSKQDTFDIKSHI